MAITIRANDANKDGKGIDFSAYLRAYNKTFVADGRGGFNGTGLGGSQYATYDKRDYGVVMNAGKKDFSYDIIKHVVVGSISSMTFGNKIDLNTKTNKYDVVSDLQISGLNITDKNDTTSANAVHQFILKLSGGKETEGGATAALVDVLKKNAIYFVGSKGSDVFSGYDKSDKIYGGAGNDKLYGGAGNDGIKGGTGNDKISGGSGSDKLYGESGTDTIKGGSGNDAISGGAGGDKLYGESGDDKIKGDSGNDRISGGDGKDRLYGGTGDDTIYGGRHDDKIYGESGNDKLYGDGGNDRLDGGTGNDTLTGGDGNDIFIFKKNQGDDRITDFSAGSGKGDVIYLDDSVLKNFSDVLAHAEDTAKGVLIEYGKGSIVLSGVEKFDLHANDFFFF